MSLSTNRLRPKIDVVLVERTTRGKFPGPKAKKETVGLVWSSWISNSEWRTEKLSLLTFQGEVCFTTRSCISKIGTFADFKDVKSAYEKYVEENFIPIFCTLCLPAYHSGIPLQVGDFQERALGNPLHDFGLSGITSEDLPDSFVIKVIGFQGTFRISADCIAKKDFEEIVKNPEAAVYSINVEPWVLKRRNII